MDTMKQDLILMLSNINFKKLSCEAVEALKNDDYTKLNKEVLKVSQPQDLNFIQFKDYERFLKNRYERAIKMTLTDYLKENRTTKDLKTISEDFERFKKYHVDKYKKFKTNRDNFFDFVDVIGVLWCDIDAMK